ncbi:hypothetical protein [Actinoplanes sp. NPDC049265]|uniref:hypothetical protein n=1 Tax=Actinoplanes sp. NPDC049265 TaxID=3363902 RepID=UPI00371013D7
MSTLLGVMVGALTNLATAGWSWGLSVGLLAAAACWTFWEVRLRGSEQRAAEVEARDKVLAPLDRAGAGEAGAFGLLVADRRVVPLQGRRATMELLQAWCDSEEPAGVLVVSGPAGVGKTRLGLEFGLQLPEPWVAGWLRPGQAAAAMSAVVDCGDPALMVIDDADTRAELPRLLEVLAEHGGRPRVRLLLIARDGDALLAGLRPLVADASRWLVQGANVVEVGALGGAGDRERWYALAVGRFARKVGVLAPSTASLAGVVGADDETMLALQARALLTVLTAPGQVGAVTAVRRLPVGQVIAELFTHEQAWWEGSAALERWGMSGFASETRERAILVLAVRGTTDEESAVRALRRVPDLADATGSQLRSLARWVASLYPAVGSRILMKPDLFGDWFITDRLTSQPRLAAALLSDLDAAEMEWALAVLTRAAAVFPSMLPVLAQVWEAAGGSRIEAAVRTVVVHHTARLDQQFAVFLAHADIPVATLEAVDAQLPEHQMPRSKAAVAQRLVALYRGLAADDPAHQPNFASALNNLGTRLWALGEHGPAYEATSEAVTLCRALVAESPAHQPTLASVLNNLGIRLWAVGEHRPAYEATSEAVTLYRALAADNPAYQPTLASVLDNLGIFLWALGEHRPAYEATSEAVTLYRALVVDSPAHQRNLASVLDNLGTRLGEVGEHRPAYEAASEAVVLYRALVLDNPAHRSGLASALDGLGGCLGALGEHRRAFEAASEAVVLYRALVADNPAHQRNLASALNNLGTRLWALGEHGPAYEATSEAVVLYRALVVDNPAHQPNFASTLDNLGTRLGAVGEHGPAFEAASEAVTLYRALVVDNPAHQPNFAIALNNLGTRLWALGEHRPAFEATSEAVVLYRALVVDNAAHQPTLASALNNLGTHLCELGEHETEFRHRQEAVDLYRTMAERDTDIYGADYERAVTNLQAVYVRHGKDNEAVRLGLLPQPRDSGDSKRRPESPATPDSPRMQD